MAGWSKEIREHTEHRWVLKAPAHGLDIAAAVDAANRAAMGLPRRTDVTVRGEDDHVVVSYTVWRDVNTPRPPAMRDSVRDVPRAAAPVDTMEDLLEDADHRPYEDDGVSDHE